MWVEEEGGNAKRHNREPEVEKVGDPNGHRHIEEDEEIAEAHVDAGTSEARIEDAEGNARCRKAASSSDVTSTTERQIAEDRIRIDLGGEDLENRRKR